MKILYLNNVITIPSEEGQKRINKALEDHGSSGLEEVYRDEHGHTREFYEDVAGKVPRGFAQEEKDFYKIKMSSGINEDGTILLMEDEVDYDAKPCIINLEDFSTAIDNESIGSVIYLKDGSEIWVVESSYEIGEYIEHLHRSFWQKFVEAFKFYYRKIKNKITGNKTVTYESIINAPENSPELINNK